MKLEAMILAGWLLTAGPVEARTFQIPPQALERESGSVFTTILKVLVKWIFPICSAYCFLYGVIGKGVKRGEWDMAAACTLASVALALFPKLLTALFGVQL